MNESKSWAFALQLLAITAALLFSAASVDAATISTQDTVVVLRVGEGSTALVAGAARAYLEEYAITFDGTGVPTAATHVQTIPVPSTGTPPGTKLLIGGTAALEGGLNFSADGQYLVFTGNDSFAGEANSGKRKIVGRIDLAGNVTLDAIYGAGTTSSGNAIRTATSLDGNQYWFGESASPGIGYRTWEGPPGDDGDDPAVTATSVNTINTRRLEIYNGQLYVSSAAGSVFGVASVGSGTPTGASSVAILPGMPTTSGPSTVDFWFADANTLYVADDRITANGGLQKWALESGTWVLKYTKNIDTSNDTFDNGLRGLTGSVGIDGTVTMFGTSTFGTAGAANFLLGISDTIANTNPANVIVTSLASSASIPGAGGAFTNFRGLEDIGVFIPEPASLALLAIGGMLLLSGRRR